MAIYFSSLTVIDAFHQNLSLTYPRKKSFDEIKNICYDSGILRIAVLQINFLLTNILASFDKCNNELILN